MSKLRQRAGNAALLILGGAVGAIAAYEAARFLELRLAKEALFHYAQSVVRVMESSADEASAAASQFDNEPQQFCSDDEIDRMRRFVYEAAYVKDIGRVRDGFLYCTSGLGKLARPLPMPKPVLSYYSPQQLAQINVMPGIALALAPQSRGLIAEMHGVTIVLNPALYGSLDDPPMHASGLVRDIEHNVVANAFGQPAPLSPAQVFAESLVEREGVFYQPLCSRRRAVCAVASESLAAMLARPHGYYVSFPATSVWITTIGGLLGISIATSILLFYHRQRSLERRLRRAVRTRQIVCAYQPVVDLDTYAIVGAEALARWTDDSGEAIAPDVFIPVAEENGFIGAVTRLVLDRVLEDMASLAKVGGFRVAMNLSSSDLGNARFFSHLEEALKRTRFPAQSLAFEITERSTALHGEGQQGIARLRASGHKVYLDDFGTGYSSLSYLHDLHADAIKIDRAFTQTVGTEAVTASVVPHILDMARRLGLGVVVEGIETADQAAYFRSEFPGAFGQGWLFGRPVAAQEFTVQFRMRRPFAGASMEGAPHAPEPGA